jgi:hypothetical protein
MKISVTVYWDAVMCVLLERWHYYIAFRFLHLERKSAQGFVMGSQTEGTHKHWTAYVAVHYYERRRG